MRVNNTLLARTQRDFDSVVSGSFRKTNNQPLKFTNLHYELHVGG